MLRAQTRKWLVRVAYKYWLIKGFKKTKNSHCNLTKKIGISYSSGHKKIGSGPIFFKYVKNYCSALGGSGIVNTASSALWGVRSLLKSRG